MSANRLFQLALTMLVQMVFAPAWASPLVQAHVSDGVFDPRRPKEVVYADEDVQLRAIASPSEREPVLISVVSQGGPERRVSLPPEIAQVHSILRSSAYADKVIVTGWMNSALAVGVVVLDLRQLAVVDYFWAYHPTPSPNGRYLAFVKFFPSHFVEGPEDQYRLYDLALSPQKNRDSPAPMPGDPGPDPKVDVGLPLYPAAAALRDNLGLTEEEAHHRASDFHWSADSLQLAFADYQAEQMRLIHVSLPKTDSSEAPRVLAYALEGTEDVCEAPCYSLKASIRLKPAGVEARFTGTAKGAEVIRSVPYSRFTRP